MNAAERTRVLVLGWCSVDDGEATAGDALSMRAVADALVREGTPVDVAWAPAVLPPGGMLLQDADPRRYTHVVWACGPLRGQTLARVLLPFSRAVVIAAGVSVLDPEDPVLARVDHLFARDVTGPGGRAMDGVVDLSAHAPTARVPVIGTVLAPGQAEYGSARRHDEVREVLEGWVGTTGAARLEIDTRMDRRSWRQPWTPDELVSVLARLDAVVTMRLHGLVLALTASVPALALDPVAGGGKVTAQARAWGWPAVLSAEAVISPGGAGLLDEGLAWCLSPEGRAAAAAALARARAGEPLSALVAAVSGAPQGVVTGPATSSDRP